MLNFNEHEDTDMCATWLSYHPIILAVEIVDFNLIIMSHLDRTTCTTCLFSHSFIYLIFNNYKTLELKLCGQNEDTWM